METSLDVYSKNVKVYIQILPPPNSCWKDVRISDDQKILFVRSKQDFAKGNLNTVPHYWKFETDGIINNKTQTDIFETYFKEPLKDAIMGVDFLTFAYGQTGTGKTSTVNGLVNTYQNRGLIPRILTELFVLKEQFKYEYKIEYSISYVEVYRPYILDLLSTNYNKKIYNPYKNIEIIPMQSEHEGYKHLFIGESRRNIYRNNSYYSHYVTSVFTIYVESISKLISNPIKKYSKIHIIDMAGIDKDGNQTCRLKTANSVGTANLNKTQLEYCLMIIQEDLIKERKVDSIRDTGILVDYLGKSLKSQSIIKFIAHINPNRENLILTFSIMKFANLARSIKPNKLKATVLKSTELLTQNLQNKIDTLQEQMYLNSMIMNEDLSFHISKFRIQQMQHAIYDYINNRTNEISVLNVTDASTALNIFKEIYNKLEMEKNDIFNKLEELTQTYISKSISKGSKDTSTISGFRIDEKKSSKVHSRMSRISKESKKRKSTHHEKMSKASKVSKQSKVLQSQIFKDFSGMGSLSKSGVSLGQLMSYNYQGDVTKSLKLKSNMLLPPSKPKVSEEISPKGSGSKSNLIKLSDINLNLHSELGDDMETIYAEYQQAPEFHYSKMNDTLEILRESSKNILQQYYQLLEQLNKKIELIDVKKNDLIKMKFYQKFANVKCTLDKDEIKKISVTQEELATKVLNLILETIQLKEEIMTLQAELKILINEYHRIKGNLKRDFTEYCIKTYNIEMPETDKIVECIEDEIQIVEFQDVNREEAEENIRMETFLKLQHELRKMQELKILKR